MSSGKGHNNDVGLAKLGEEGVDRLAMTGVLISDISFPSDV